MTRRCVRYLVSVISTDHAFRFTSGMRSRVLSIRSHIFISVGPMDVFRNGTARIDATEIGAGPAKIGHQQRMLVRRAQPRRQFAVQVQRRVVAERLGEDRVAAGAQNSRDFGKAFGQIEMMQNAMAEYHVERAVGECRVLGVHDGEFAMRQPLRLRGDTGNVDRPVRNVDAAKFGGAVGQMVVDQ